MIRAIALAAVLALSAPHAYAADSGAATQPGYELEITVPDSFAVDTRPMTGLADDIEPAIVTDDERHKDIILAWV